ncbi:methyltransferase domain-containing protein [Candidatus Saccharibacteria bacterium]|nr:methyltransferase domain-containing protein [Candidatus Saccharibacteria bacterium]
MKLDELSRRLRGVGVEQADLEALVLAEFVTGLTRAKLLAGDFKLRPTQAGRLRQLIRRRGRQPLAYLLKRKEFYGRNFYVDRRVLIPRPESEDLVEAALGLGTGFGRLYDVGCGSGCLAISYLKTRAGKPPGVQLLDASRQALRVARKNCRRHSIGRVTFSLQDVSALPAGYFAPGSLILANLPYLDITERGAYERGSPMLRSEPAASLYAGGGGLELYGSLLKACAGQDLTLVCESLPPQRAALEKLAAAGGFRPNGRRGLATVFSPLTK